jgi:hypothetical protein
MKKLLLASAVLAATSAAQATTFDVSGSFIASSPLADSALMMSIGGPNIIDDGSFVTLSGEVINDGANITGGTIHLVGTQTMNPTGTDITLTMDMYGTASNDGVLFTSGNICVTAVTECDTGDIDVSVDNIDFQDGLAWGYNSGVGLQLGDGTEDASYTVAQPGNMAQTGGPGGGAAVGGAVLLGNAAGIFFNGDIVFTRVAIVPVPAAAWLFGSALVGLVGLGRRKAN